jgi:hypothetical protein
VLVRSSIASAMPGAALPRRPADKNNFDGYVQLFEKRPGNHGNFGCDLCPPGWAGFVTGSLPSPQGPSVPADGGLEEFLDREYRSRTMSCPVYPEFCAPVAKFSGYRWRAKRISTCGSRSLQSTPLAAPFEVEPAFFHQFVSAALSCLVRHGKPEGPASGF